MTEKEKVQAALQHQEGTIPIDLGGGPTSGMHCSIVEGLRDYYGLEKKPVTVMEPYQMLGLVEEDLQDAIGTSMDLLWSPYTMYANKNVNWKEWKTPWGQVVLISDDFTTTTDENGDVYIYAEGDTNYPPSAKMPSNGFFFDSLERQSGFDEDNLNPEDNLEEFGEIDDFALDYLKQEAEKLKGTTRGVFGNFGGTAIGDIAFVPGPMLKEPKGIRDITEWYVSTVTRQDYLHKVFEGETGIALKNLEKIYKVVGDLPTVGYICGTDFGTQSSSFCSTDTYVELYHPYYKKINDWIHKNTNWKTFKHSCGAVFDFMPHFIESGFDIINPVQLSAAGMDGPKLKKEFGDKLVFWGGGIDTQKTLPFGTPEEVRREVLNRCEIFAPGGGFVFNTIHNVVAKSPIENVVAMIDAVHEFNGKR